MHTDISFISVPELVSELQGAFQEGSATLARIMGVALTAAYLVLDDLGAARSTEFVVGKLLHILDSRVNYQMPTLITSNFTIADLGNTLDPRVASRIYALGPVKVMKGPDRRRTMALKKPNRSLDAEADPVP